MKIKKIKLYGFKSFPEETDIILNAGITAFVGPNGSGKSNIFDALRWVFGEQSMKALRCEKIEDLIYMSPDLKNDANFTEVSVTIDNEDYFPQFGGEFEIKRRFYKTGESEFFLNRVKCRLLDIQALFLNSGTLSYSFLELSEIEKIIHGETKQMFDDVSGILKYQERREQTRRRLEATEQDLLRLEDIIHEMQRSLRSLRRQVRQTRLYQELREEYKRLTLFLLKDEYTKAQEELHKIEEEIQEKESRKQTVSQEIKRLEAEREELKNKMSEIEVRKKDTVERIAEVDKSIAELSSAIQSKEEESRQIILSNERTITVIREKEESLRNARERLVDYQSKEESFIEQINKIKTEIEEEERAVGEKNNLYFSLKTDLRKYDDTAAELSDKIREYKDAITKLKFEKENKEEILTRINEEYQSKKEEIEGGQRRKKELEEELEQIIVQQESLSKELEEDNKIRQEHEDSIHTLEIDLKERQEALTDCKVVIDTLRRRLKEKEGIREIDDIFSKKHRGLLRDNIEVNPGYELVVDICLGDLLHFYILTEYSEEDFNRLPEGRFGFINADTGEKKEAAEELDKELTSVAQFVKFKSSHGFVQKYINNYFLVDDFAKANELSRKHPDCGFITKNGILFKNGLIIVEKGEIGYFKISQSLQEYEKKLEDLKNEVIFINEDKKRLQEEIEAINEKIEEKKNRLFAVNVKKSECSLKLNETERNVDKTVKYYEGVKNDRDNILKEIERLKSQIEEFEEKIRTAEREFSDIEEQKKGLLEKIKTMEGELEEKGTVINKKRMDLIAMEERRKSVRGSIEQLQAEIKKVEDELDILRQNRTAENLEQIQTEIDVLKKELILKKEERTNLEKLLPEKMMEELTQKLNKVFDSLAESQKLHEELQNEVMQFRYQSFQLKHKRDEAFKKALDDFKVDLNEYLPEEEIPEAETKLAETKGKLEKLGEVNPLSLELYDKEKKRLDEFLAQRDDVIAAKKNLLGSIEELDTRARERFVTTFERVKKEFNFVFANFFEGGAADLVLSDPDNPLTSKVDIVVRMKGKRLKTINQLSGGERTLLAISLLLAFYLVKPAPFCILDEIDAPLDDANVVRFNKFLRDLSQRTQVVIITHNRATMEYADYLYGLTMEKPGQSKIISAKLADLEKWDLDA